MTEPSGKCLVVSVKGYLIFKRVCFQAEQDCSFSRLMLRLGDRAKFPATRRYSIAARSTIWLPYPSWKQLQPGQVVSFSALAMHPFSAWNGLRA